MPGTHINWEEKTYIGWGWGTLQMWRGFSGSFLVEVTCFPPLYSQSQDTES